MNGQDNLDGLSNYSNSERRKAEEHCIYSI
jgi:hypothetical protein